MNLQCAYLQLAIVSPPPTPPGQPIAGTSPRLANKAANDNYPVWPLLPFPAGWCASN
ncbi:hypothetical protein M2427_007405 [Bradyrhizobium sp. BR13661]|nr:hypothetical protein [Bradyrhizobium sp. BR13661]